MNTPSTETLPPVNAVLTNAVSRMPNEHRRQDRDERGDDDDARSSRSRRGPESRCVSHEQIADHGDCQWTRDPRDPSDQEPDRRAERDARVEVRPARLRETAADLGKAQRHSPHEDRAEHPGEQTPYPGDRIRPTGQSQDACADHGVHENGNEQREGDASQKGGCVSGRGGRTFVTKDRGRRWGRDEASTGSPPLGF